MGFFDALGKFLEARRDARGNAGEPRMAETGALDEDLVNDSAHPEYPDGKVVAADPAEMAAPPEPVEYDLGTWRKKLKRILERLPATEGEWPDLMTEAGALNLETAWVEQCMREEFALMVRGVVGDRVVTLQEHSKLERARTLIGLSDAEAEAILGGIVAEAEAFFRQPIEGAQPPETAAEAGAGTGSSQQLG